MRRSFELIILAALLLVGFYSQAGSPSARKSEAAPLPADQPSQFSEVAPRQEPDEDDSDITIGSREVFIGLCGVVLLIILIGAAMMRGLPTLGPIRRPISTRDYDPPPGEGEPRRGVIEPPPDPDFVRRSPLEDQALPETADPTEAEDLD